MGRMTVTQLEYAKHRLIDAYDEVLGPPPHQNIKQKYAKIVPLIRAGKLKVTPNDIQDALLLWENHLDDCAHPAQFGRYIGHIVNQKCNNLYDNTYEKELETYQNRKEKLDKLYNAALDQLYLGDAKEALEIITNFRRLRPTHKI